MPDKNFTEDMLESVGLGDEDKKTMKKRGRKGGRSSSRRKK